MIEARTGYFEASRHMLVAFQKLVSESFSLQDHIVHLDNDVGPPGKLRIPQEESSSLLRKESFQKLDCRFSILYVEWSIETLQSNSATSDDYLLDIQLTLIPLPQLPLKIDL